MCTFGVSEQEVVMLAGMTKAREQLVDPLGISVNAASWCTRLATVPFGNVAWERWKVPLVNIVFG